MDAHAVPRAAAAVDLRWLLSVAAGAVSALLLLLLAASPAAPFHHLRPASLFLAPSRRALPPLFVESTLSSSSATPATPPPSLPPPPPRFAYLISGSAGDAPMLRRCLLALYHPRNSYILHLDAQAPDSDRADLATFVAAHPVLSAAANVRVILKANLVTYRGPTMVTTTLHAAAAFLWGRGAGRGADWDWFINLSASDYPLVTQDDLMHVFSKLPRDLNFIDHTSDIGWKAFARAMPMIVDPGLYMKTKGELFWIPERRSLPTAFKLFTGSAWMVLSRPFVEYLIWGWDNLPRTVLMYYANFISSPEGYFHTVACNADAFKNTTVNSDLHFISWDNPPMQHPHYLAAGDWDRMLASDAPFARKFRRDEPVLDRIDADVLSRRPGMVAPGAWCGAAAAVAAAGGGNSSSSSASDVDPCAAAVAGRGESETALLLRPGPGAERLQRLVTWLLSEQNFRPRQCKVAEAN
ncbi:beta-glucuronosyltransferase GlcAT14B-like [Oryza brachyantha]|uniref:beta-glucuronosyltransferase GlcAT14B-like n=1 Tax=Oryza brachyantha TaxID=4533 RepID=UPI001ADD4C7F|nr:beta-glucuronosyltransferase GlcAT14B-like [Oryza brachyantha]